MANIALPASGPKLGEQHARFTIRKTGFPDNYTSRADPSAPTPITDSCNSLLIPCRSRFSRPRRRPALGARIAADRRSAVGPSAAVAVYTLEWLQWVDGGPS